MNKIVLDILFMGDYSVHVNRIVPGEQDYKLPVNRIVACEQDSCHEHCMHMASVNMQNSRREQDS